MTDTVKNLQIHGIHFNGAILLLCSISRISQDISKPKKISYETSRGNKTLFSVWLSLIWLVSAPNEVSFIGT